MSDMRTAGIKKIERSMEGIPEDSVRYKVLESAKDFKTSWISLGQALFTVFRDKLYREWGYQEFEAYALKEVGVQKQTALKLLRSYSFLEREEPRYLEMNLKKEAAPAEVPTYEAVDVLRLAKGNKDLAGSDYAKVRKYVLEDVRDAKEVKKDLACIIKERREEDDPEEAEEKKQRTLLKRMLGVLKSVRAEFKASKNLPAGMMKDIESLIGRIENEVGE